MAKHKKFYEKEYSKHVGATALFISSFLSLVFASVGTPLGQLMKRGPTQECYTLWGIRPNCWNAEYQWRVEEETCYERRVRWEASEAFSVVALFSLALLMGCSWVQLSGSNIKLCTLFLSAFAIGSTCVPWACITAMRYADYCGKTLLSPSKYKYGSGFCLLVTSFAIQCVGFLLFLFLEPSEETKA